MIILQSDGKQPKILSVPKGHLGLAYTSLSRGQFDPLNILHRDLSRIPFDLNGDEVHNFVGYFETNFLPELVPTSHGWFSKGETVNLWGPVSPGCRLQTLFTLVDYSPALNDAVRTYVHGEARKGHMSRRLEGYVLKAGITHQEMEAWTKEYVPEGEERGIQRKIEDLLLLKSGN